MSGASSGSFIVILLKNLSPLEFLAYTVYAPYPSNSNDSCIFLAGVILKVYTSLLFCSKYSIFEISIYL